MSKEIQQGLCMADTRSATNNDAPKGACCFVALRDENPRGFDHEATLCGTPDTAVPT